MTKKEIIARNIKESEELFDLYYAHYDRVDNQVRTLEQEVSRLLIDYQMLNLEREKLSELRANIYDDYIVPLIRKIHGLESEKAKMKE